MNQNRRPRPAANILRITVHASLFCLLLQVLDLQANDSRVISVSLQEITEAMQLQSGYDPTATTNVARFQAEVILQLARTARERDPNGPPLLVGHAEWFWAFLEVNGLTPETAPGYALLAYHHRQDQLVDYDPGHVIKQIVNGNSPVMAVNVQVSWPETSELPAKYSFEDTLSTPKLKVTNHRLITYRLLDFGDMIVYDDIKGLSGRPTSGMLGLLFRIIGEGRVVQSRMVLSEDGLQINRTKAKKGLFGVTATVTIQPDGRTEKDLPKDRPELVALEDKLKRHFKIRYHDIRLLHTSE